MVVPPKIQRKAERLHARLWSDFAIRAMIEPMVDDEDQVIVITLLSYPGFSIHVCAIEGDVRLVYADDDSFCSCVLRRLKDLESMCGSMRRFADDC